MLLTILEIVPVEGISISTIQECVYPSILLMCFSIIEIHCFCSQNFFFLILLHILHLLSIPALQLGHPSYLVNFEHPNADRKKYCFVLVMIGNPELQQWRPNFPWLLPSNVLKCWSVPWNPTNRSFFNCF